MTPVVFIRDFQQDFSLLTSPSQQGIISRNEIHHSLKLRAIGALVFFVSSAIFLVSLPFWFNFPLLGLIPLALSSVGIVGGHDLAQVGVNIGNILRRVESLSRPVVQIDDLIENGNFFVEIIASEFKDTPWHLRNTWAFQYFPNAREIFKHDSCLVLSL